MQISKNNKNQLVLTFEYSAILVEIMRQFDSRKFIEKTKEWVVPIIHIIQIVDTLKPIGFEISPDVLEEYNNAKKKKRKIRRIRAGRFKDSEKELLKKTKLPLFEYQEIGVGFLVTTKSALLGDEPGLGKTLQTLATTKITKSKKNLVVCPSTIKLNWADEIVKWVPTAKIFVVSGSKKQRTEIYEKAQKAIGVYYLIINYELLRFDIKELQKF